MKMWSYG